MKTVILKKGSNFFCYSCGALVKDENTSCWKCDSVFTEIITETVKTPSRETNEETNQLVSELSYSGFWKRMAAAIVDGVVITIGINIIIDYFFWITLGTQLQLMNNL